MPNMTVVLRSRNLWVEIKNQKEEWGCNFFGKCKRAETITFDSTPYDMVNSNATITFEDQSTKKNSSELPIWKTENPHGAVWVDFDKSVGGRHLLQATIGVPRNVYQKVLTTDFTKDEILVYIEFLDFTKRSETGANAFLKGVRIHFHTLIGHGNDVFGHDHAE